jgi:pimeloyl-ACP methyl ester carboxylesterase
MRQSKISGVLVEFEGEPGTGTPPLLFVHGGAHGSWTWGKMMPWFAARGWVCAAMNWYGHHGSDPLPHPERVTRSITDVAREIGIVAAHLGWTARAHRAQQKRSSRIRFQIVVATIN